MFLGPVDNRWFYTVADSLSRSMQPLSEYWLSLAKQYHRFSEYIDLPAPFSNHYFPKECQEYYLKNWRYVIRSIAGMYYIAHLGTNLYEKPEWGIEDVQIEDTYYEVVPEVVTKKPFCDLLRFRKVISASRVFPKLLLVAPLSGHYATLLRDTVNALLPRFDVYITDWKNARDVPLTKGSFDFDKYTAYMMSFMRQLGPDLHVMAVCQPAVPVLAALSLMSEDNDPTLPYTAILLGGPIDTEQTPTQVNALASTRGDDWFKQNVISIVPSHYPGYMRLVYPGFMQLSCFLSMNPQRHIESFKNMLHHYASGDMKGAEKIIRFYKEYFSTMDMTAEFYMQTIHLVFQKVLLAKGRLKARGRYAQLKDIRSTAILAIEGEKDDITGIGQTKSVLKLCKNLPDNMKRYFLAEGVGHYGLFNGSQFRKKILPEICSFIEAHTRSTKI